jgi:hypothetical protein
VKKTPTIFKRNPENMKEILPEPHNDCDWVFSGEGVATRKYDGTCCLVKDGKLWKRREIKKGKLIPEGFKLADYDEVTGKAVGWVPVTDSKEDRWHLEAFGDVSLPDGTYELCGPKVQGNPEGFESHVLVPHSEATRYENVLRTFEGIKSFLDGMDIEGLVFHHQDGRMAKIKKRDYQQPRKVI